MRPLCPSLAAVYLLFTCYVSAQPAVTIEADATHITAHLPASFYGVMTEEINHSYDGGLYAELIQNRSFQDGSGKNLLPHWTLAKTFGSQSVMDLDPAQPLSPALTKSLRLKVDGTAAVSNDGFWGVGIKPHTTYRVSFYARAEGIPELTVALQSGAGWVDYAHATVALSGTGWKQYTATLSTGSLIADPGGSFALRVAHSGTLWLNLVSVFPPTFHDRPNGNRPDLMLLLAGLKPAFIRLPGGNYLEGESYQERFAWKSTLGPLRDRPGHMGCWGYRSSDGLGLLEYLEWCEDLGAEPLLAVYAGYSLNHSHLAPGPALQPAVQEALEEIEYVTGGPDTDWGRRRAADGHPAPFPLHYVEVGNEDAYDSSHSYNARFTQFFDAIRAKYPDLKIIATTPVTTRKPDVIDNHAYRSVDEMEHKFHYYDSADRTGPKIFEGEWATIEGSPTPSFASALGDASFLAGLERNADIVCMESYAPLLANVNPHASEWSTNLIGFDSLTSFGSPSYHVQKMFAAHHGDEVLSTVITGTDFPCTVTHDSHSGAFFLHVVNAAATPLPVRLRFRHASHVGSHGRAFILTARDGKDQNEITAPDRIVPREEKLPRVSDDFSYSFPAHSVTVLVLGGE